VLFRSVDSAVAGPVQAAFHMENEFDIIFGDLDDSEFASVTFDLEDGVGPEVAEVAEPEVGTAVEGDHSTFDDSDLSDLDWFLSMSPSASSCDDAGVDMASSEDCSLLVELESMAVHSPALSSSTSCSSVASSVGSLKRGRGVDSDSDDCSAAGMKRLHTHSDSDSESDSGDASLFSVAARSAGGAGFARSADGHVVTAVHYKGTSYRESRCKWQVQVTVRGYKKKATMGEFRSAEEAGSAFNYGRHWLLSHGFDVALTANEGLPEASPAVRARVDGLLSRWMASL